jgi:hypothetical protein
VTTLLQPANSAAAKIAITPCLAALCFSDMPHTLTRAPILDGASTRCPPKTTERPAAGCAAHEKRAIRGPPLTVSDQDRTGQKVIQTPLR